MKLVTLFAFAFLSTMTFATDTTTPAEKWTCYAEGKQGFGGPVGDIWTTVTGNGTSQLEATNAALQNCMGNGLSRCMVSVCHVKK
jgi:hypothetical protein